jgi:hypothetical protein
LTRVSAKAHGEPSWFSAGFFFDFTGILPERKGNAMTEMLQEFFDSRGAALRVDRQSAVIRGVKVLGLESRNGRSYLPDALAQAAPLYEDAKVNVNHPKGNPAGPRDYQDRIGVIRNVALRSGEGLFADLHFNPKHSLAEQLLWDAEHAPENVGFSHNVEARTARRGDRMVVEAITRVQSVDLVADPDTTRGLFESAEDGEAANQSQPAATPPLTLDDLKRDYPELVEEIRRESADENRRLREELKHLSDAAILREKTDTARRLLREFRLPEPDSTDPLARTIVSEKFFESLLACFDESAMRDLLEERARLVKTLADAGSECGSRERQPTSRDQHSLCGAGRMDTKSFLESIT